jgi:hypothetical protein
VKGAIPSARAGALRAEPAAQSQAEPLIPIARHTPGQWEAADYWNDRSLQIPVTDCDGGPIANVWGGNDEAFANARLIAAAPELLEACEAVANHLAIKGSALQTLIHAAIAKARGQ